MSNKVTKTQDREILEIEKRLGRSLGDPKTLEPNQYENSEMKSYILSLLESENPELNAAGKKLALLYDTLGLICSNEYATREAVAQFGNGYHLDDCIREAVLFSTGHLQTWREKGWIKPGGERLA